MELNETNEQGQNSTGTETPTENRTYSQAEVDELLQKETDRRVSQALATQQRKNEAKIKEAEKLAQMNAQERYEYELEQRAKAIEEKERELRLAENKATASKILAEKGLSQIFVDFVVQAEDAETMNSYIQQLERAYKADVKAGIERALGGKAPTAPSGTVTKEQFGHMTIAQLQNLANTDRDTYNALVAGK